MGHRQGSSLPRWMQAIGSAFLFSALLAFANSVCAASGGSEAIDSIQGMAEEKAVNNGVGLYYPDGMFDGPTNKDAMYILLFKALGDPIRSATQFLG